MNLIAILTCTQYTMKIISLKRFGEKRIRLNTVPVPRIARQNDGDRANKMASPTNLTPQQNSSGSGNPPI